MLELMGFVGWPPAVACLKAVVSPCAELYPCGYVGNDVHAGICLSQAFIAIKNHILEKIHEEDLKKRTSHRYFVCSGNIKTSLKTDKAPVE